MKIVYYVNGKEKKDVKLIFQNIDLSAKLKSCCIISIDEKKFKEYICIVHVHHITLKRYDTLQF
jgi:hypothetical protein